MRLTRDYIINHIRETKYPCWSLFVLQAYKRVPIMHYNGEDWMADDDTGAKAEKAVARLNGALQSIPPDTLLCIELRSSKGANGVQGTLGPFEFTNIDKDDAPAQQQAQQPQQQAAGLSGFGFMQPPPGWVLEETLNGKLESLAAQQEHKINEILLKQREKEFDERRNRELREIAEIKKELNDERRKYESSTGAAADTLVMAVKKILGELFPALPFNKAEAQPATLLGADTSRPTDPKYGAVEALANAMYQDPALTEQDVNEIALAIKQRAAMKHNTPPQRPQEEATVIEFPKEAGGTQNV